MTTSRPATEVIQREQGQELLSVQRALLRVVKGPDRGVKVELRGRPVLVGIDSDCDLVLGDSAVSRVRFEIHTLPDGFLLRDRKSTNGTVVAGLRVREVFLVSGARCCGARNAQLIAGPWWRAISSISPVRRRNGGFPSSLPIAAARLPALSRNRELA